MTFAQVSVRDATDADAARCAAIYAPYVEQTAITFELSPPSPQEFGRRISDAQATHAWLVATDGDTVVGYAYAHEYKTREAYDWCCEVSIYLEMGRRRTGAGRVLYRELLDRVCGRGYQTAVAVIALPNDASVGLHRTLGFEHVGTLRRVGWKHSAWHDVAVCQLHLAHDSTPGSSPRRRHQ
jgi:L-amino acid N-acyltransferase YncA